MSTRWARAQGPGRGFSMLGSGGGVAKCGSPGPPRAAAAARGGGLECRRFRRLCAALRSGSLVRGQSPGRRVRHSRRDSRSGEVGPHRAAGALGQQAGRRAKLDGPHGMTLERAYSTRAASRGTSWPARLPHDFCWSASPAPTPACCRARRALAGTRRRCTAPRGRAGSAGR